MEDCILRQQHQEQEPIEKNVSFSSIHPEDKPKLLEALNEIINRKLSIKKQLQMTLLGQGYDQWPGTPEEKHEALAKVIPSKLILKESQVEKMQQAFQELKKNSTDRVCLSHSHNSSFSSEVLQNNAMEIEQEALENLISVFSLLDTGFEEAMLTFSCLVSKEHKLFFSISQMQCPIADRPAMHLYAIDAQESPNKVKNVNDSPEPLETTPDV